MRTKVLSSGQADNAPNAGGSLSALPVFHAAWLFALGIASTQWLLLRPTLILFAIFLVSLLSALAAFFAQRLIWMALAVLWLLLGAWSAQMEPEPAPAPEAPAETTPEAAEEKPE